MQNLDYFGNDQLTGGGGGGGGKAASSSSSSTSGISFASLGGGDGGALTPVAIIGLAAVVLFGFLGLVLLARK